MHSSCQIFERHETCVTDCEQENSGWFFNLRIVELLLRYEKTVILAVGGG